METGTRSILFVDDDQKYRRLLTSIVADSGFEICQAGSAEEALVILGGKRFDLMVTDLLMPGLDGLELAALAKRLDPGLEIVLATGAVSPEVLGEASSIGIRTVLAKPCRVEDILAVVRGETLPPSTAAGGIESRVTMRMALGR
ncbi:response regulator [Geomonas sp. Red69]|uniref:response regulator n=1 Tax=Geomonas diazotrophica TaxID=2843197 RepID=UPI001C118AB2|nr:response regulator [Geomonas diazotrophica]MBU5635979.1 response regulator [Geomonas diazotrophica]